MEKRKRKKKRRGGSPRGHHGEEKLHGLATWTRHVFNQDGEPETITIRVPADLATTRFVWSCTAGFVPNIERATE